MSWVLLEGSPDQAKAPVAIDKLHGEPHASEEQDGISRTCLTMISRLNRKKYCPVCRTTHGIKQVPAHQAGVCYYTNRIIICNSRSTSQQLRKHVLGDFMIIERCRNPPLPWSCHRRRYVRGSYKSGLRGVVILASVDLHLSTMDFSCREKLFALEPADAARVPYVGTVEMRDGTRKMRRVRMASGCRGLSQLRVSMAAVGDLGILIRTVVIRQEVMSRLQLPNRECASPVAHEDMSTCMIDYLGSCAWVSSTFRGS